VAGEDRFLGTKTVERAEKLALGGKLLDDRFDPQVAIFQVFDNRSGLQAAPDFSFGCFRDCTLLHQTGQVLFDAFDSLVHKFGAYFSHYSRKTGGRTNLRDSRAHQPTPHDSDFLNGHDFSSLDSRDSRSDPPRGRKKSVSNSHRTLPKRRDSEHYARAMFSTIIAMPCPPPMQAVARP